MSELADVRWVVEDRIDTSTSVPPGLGASAPRARRGGGGADRCRAVLREIGFTVKSVEPDAQRLAELPESGLPLMPYAGRRCLVGELAGDGSRVLVLNGRVDVVSRAAGAVARSAVRGRRGRRTPLRRGSADMKGGIAAMLLAVEAARSLGPLPANIVFQSVIEEECIGNGALVATLAGPTPDAVLIAEPTNVGDTIGGVGVIYARITITGESGHALLSDQRTNPLDEAYRIIGSLRELEDRLNERPDPPFADVERPNLLNVGALHAGDWPATSPGKAKLDVRLGFPATWSRPAPRRCSPRPSAARCPPPT